ncbi:MAG: linear amide C-N hydrolase [Desulfobacteraceae bacterium]|nr:linear amide C-N hydrolase [Desulfobacteraceae bacterium]
MKTKISIWAIVMVLGIGFWDTGWACSTFVLQDPNKKVFGRNYDWSLGDCLVMVNKPGCIKQSVEKSQETDKRFTWKAKYGNITFNQYGRDLPMDGMNEKGLVIGSMALWETRYPETDERPYMGSSAQFRQYLLDTCATVEEVLATYKHLRISHTAIGPGMHLLVLDKKGDCATIEFLNGKLKVHRGKQLPVAVLTNDTYEHSLECYRSGNAPWFSVNHSITRFVTAARLVEKSKAKPLNDPVALAFNILDAVAQPSTQWSIVYDNQNMRVHFITLKNKMVRFIRFNAFDFSSATPVKILNANAGFSGDVTKKFLDYTYEANRHLIGESFRKTSFLSQIPTERLDEVARLPEQVTCP